MNPPRRVRKDMKMIEGLKAAAIIILLLFVCIMVLWITTQYLRPVEPPPDLAPRPAKEMWEQPGTPR
jgi:hypothetical protein